MKRWITAAALLAVFSLVGGAQAKEKKAGKVAHGKIVSIAPDATDKTLTDIVVAVGGKKDPQQVTVTANKDTVVMIDGNTAQLSEIKVGQHVALTPSTGLLQKLEVVSHHKKKIDDSTAAAPTTKPSAPSTQPTAAAK